LEKKAYILSSQPDAFCPAKELTQTVWKRIYLYGSYVTEKSGTLRPRVCTPFFFIAFHSIVEEESH
jgi:hypothetical protein